MHTVRSRTTRFSLPAEPSAALVLRRFIREIARGTDLHADEITQLQHAITVAFNEALSQQKEVGEGRVALKIEDRPDEISVDLIYRETHSPPPSSSRGFSVFTARQKSPQSQV